MGEQHNAEIAICALVQQDTASVLLSVKAYFWLYCIIHTTVTSHRARYERCIPWYAVAEDMV